MPSGTQIILRSCGPLSLLYQEFLNLGKPILICVPHESTYGKKLKVRLRLETRYPVDRALNQ